jgi:hypothetical protein
LEDAEREERDKIDTGTEKLGLRFGGQLLVRFQNEDKTVSAFKKVSAHLVAKKGDFFVALTSMTNLKYNPTDG